MNESKLTAQQCCQCPSPSVVPSLSYGLLSSSSWFGVAVWEHGGSFSPSVFYPAPAAFWLTRLLPFHLPHPLIARLNNSLSDRQFRLLQLFSVKSFYFYFFQFSLCLLSSESPFGLSLALWTDSSRLASLHMWKKSLSGQTQLSTHLVPPHHHPSSALYQNSFTYYFNI